MKKSKNTPKSEPKPLPRDLFFEADTATLVRLLEGPMMQCAAAQLVANVGALRLCWDEKSESCVVRMLEQIEGRDAFGGFMDVHDSPVTDKLSYAARTKVEHAALDAIHLRTVTAYLLGLAVGQRLGARPFTGVTANRTIVDDVIADGYLQLGRASKVLAKAGAQ